MARAPIRVHPRTREDIISATKRESWGSLRKLPSRIPAPLVCLPSRGSMSAQLSRLMGLPARVSFRDFDWVARARELAVPTLIVHDMRDDSVPASTASALSERCRDLVQLEPFGAGAHAVLEL